MKKENIITIILYIISFCIVYAVAFPIYNGHGINTLGTSNIIYEIAKQKDLKALELTANNLVSSGKAQYLAYSEIDPEKISRIDISIPKKIDIARVVNDISKVADQYKLKMSETKFSKNTNSKKYNNLNVYDLSFSFEGDYLAFKEFLNEMQNSLQIYNIKSVSFTKSENQISSGSYKFLLSLEAFELK